MDILSGLVLTSLVFADPLNTELNGRLFEVVSPLEITVPSGVRGFLAQDGYFVYSRGDDFSDAEKARFQFPILEAKTTKIDRTRPYCYVLMRKYLPEEKQVRFPIGTRLEIKDAGGGTGVLFCDDREFVSVECQRGSAEPSRPLATDDIAKAFGGRLKLIDGLWKDCGDSVLHTSKPIRIEPPKKKKKVGPAPPDGDPAEELGCLSSLVQAAIAAGKQYPEALGLSKAAKTEPAAAVALFGVPLPALARCKPKAGFEPPQKFTPMFQLEESGAVSFRVLTWSGCFQGTFPKPGAPPSIFVVRDEELGSFQVSSEATQAGDLPYARCAYSEASAAGQAQPIIPLAPVPCPDRKALKSIVPQLAREIVAKLEQTGLRAQVPAIFNSAGWACGPLGGAAGVPQTVSQPAPQAGAPELVAPQSRGARKTVARPGDAPPAASASGASHPGGSHVDAQ